MVPVPNAQPPQIAVGEKHVAVAGLPAEAAINLAHAARPRQVFGTHLREVGARRQLAQGSGGEKTDMRVVRIERDHVHRRGHHDRTQAAGFQHAMKLHDGALGIGQMLEQPAAEYAFEISIREGNLISAAQGDLELLCGVILDQVWRVIDGDDAARVLAGEPAAARSHVGDGPLALESRFIPESAPYHFDLADDPFAGGKNVLAVRRFRHARRQLSATIPNASMAPCRARAPSSTVPAATGWLGAVGAAFPSARASRYVRPMTLILTLGNSGQVYTGFRPAPVLGRSRPRGGSFSVRPKLRPSSLTASILEFATPSTSSEVWRSRGSFSISTNRSISGSSSFSFRC